MYVTCILCANLCIGLQLKPLNIAATASKLLLCGCTLIGPVAHAREIASIPTTGFLFKDSLKVTSFNDPKVEGVALYIADIDRSITDKLHSDYFSDPSSSSIACTKSGPITLSKDVSTSAQGEEIFEEARNLFFKVIVPPRSCVHHLIILHAVNNAHLH